MTKRFVSLSKYYRSLGITWLKEWQKDLFVIGGERQPELYLVQYAQALA